MKKIHWLFVCCLLAFVHMNARSQTYNQNGITVTGYFLNMPYSIFVDASRNLFVADAGSNRVLKFAPGSVIGLTVAGGNGRGVAANQFSAPMGLAIDALGSMYVNDRGNNRVQRFDLANNLTCPADIVVYPANCAEKITINWTEPAAYFPDTIRIPLYLDANQGTLTFMGTLNGHGYYKSTGIYHWRVAKEISEFIGDTGVDGHLVTITTLAESNFLSNLTTATGLTPWIGLYSTGKPGSFRWVTDEPYSFTKWASGEPNNNLGNAANMAEPFVHMYDVGSWNDQRSINLRFVTEFEKPLIQYRQISGPANGSLQSVGSYRICYERKNMVTDQTDTCCFGVTVKCFTGSVIQPAPALSNRSTGNALQATAYPNPNDDQFTLKMTGSSKEMINLRVLEITGKIVETKSGLAPNNTVQIGSSLKAGVYIVELTQGTK